MHSWDKNVLFDWDWLMYGASGKEVYRTLTDFFEQQQKRAENRNGSVPAPKSDGRDKFKNTLGKHVYHPRVMNKLSYLEQDEIDDLYLEYAGTAMTEHIKQVRKEWLKMSEQMQDIALAEQIEALYEYPTKVSDKVEYLRRQFYAFPLAGLFGNTKEVVKTLIEKDVSWLEPPEVVIQERSRATV